MKNYIFKILEFSLILPLLVFTSCSHQKPKSECDSFLSAQTQNPNRYLMNKCHDEAFTEHSTSAQSSEKLWQSLCENYQHARSCSNLAYFKDNPIRGQKRDTESAKNYYAIACDYNDGVACYNLATLMLAQAENASDRKQLHSLFIKACDLKYAGGCYRAALTLPNRSTLSGSDTKSDPKTRELFERGCTLGEMMACHDLGYTYLEPNDSTRDPQKAAELFEKSCNAKLPRGCGSLGYLYMTGDGVKLDFKKALELQLRACEGKDGSSCSNYGYMLEKGLGDKENVSKAAVYYIKSCELGDTMGCANYGVLLADGRGVAQNDTQALPYFQRGCKDKLGESCRYLGLFYKEGRGGLKKSSESASSYLKQACALGEKKACK